MASWDVFDSGPLDAAAELVAAGLHDEHLTLPGGNAVAVLDIRSFGSRDFIREHPEDPGQHYGTFLDGAECVIYLGPPVAAPSRAPGDWAAPGTRMLRAFTTRDEAIDEFAHMAESLSGKGTRPCPR